MASDYVPSRFLSFPNEIIRTVFDYLSPIDLVVSFGYLLNERLQGLIALHISSLDLSSIDLPLDWLNQHLSVVQRHVKHISIDITFVEKLLKMMPVLDALTIVYDEDTQHLLHLFVTHFQKMKNVHIGALTLSTYAGTIRSETAELLLGGNGQLPENTLIGSCRFQINIHGLPSSQLRHMNLIVQEEKILHALCARLPNLETIKIGFISSGLQTDMSFYENLEIIDISHERDDDDESGAYQRTSYPTYKAKDKADDITVVAPAHLRSIVIQGHIANFNRLYRLFELSSASLKTINMNVWAYSIIDPGQINNVASHIDFRFDIDYDRIGVPSDFDWQKYVDGFTRRPALRCDNMVFCNLSAVINRSVFWIKTTKMFVTSPHILCFSQVHTLKFQYCKMTMNTEAVEFIQQAFPQMRTLVWRLSQPKISTKIRLDMVTTLVIHSEDRKALGSLFLLCPNVSRVRFTQAFEQPENLPELEDALIQNTCKQITLVQLVSGDDIKKSQINELFPNANVTYDATPFYEKMF